MESEKPRGTVNPWDRLDCGDARGNVLAFASSILDASRTWQDVALAGLPGNASRIVAIRLSDDQGGLNLNMPPATIEAMNGLGLAAGTKLVDAFATGTPEPLGWKAHRWIRYRATMGAITRWIDGFTSGYSPFPEQPLQETYAALITELVPIESKAPCKTRHKNSHRCRSFRRFTISKSSRLRCCRRARWCRAHLNA